MGIVEALMLKRQRSGHGVKQQKAIEGLLTKRSFQPGECPHFEAKWSKMDNNRKVDFSGTQINMKGANSELSDFHPRRSVMKVSPRDQERGHEKVHFGGHCGVAMRGIGHGADSTRMMTAQIAGPGAANFSAGFNRPRHRTGKPDFSIIKQTVRGVAQCSAVTRKKTRCQNRPMPGTTLCSVHTRASTTAGA